MRFPHEHSRESHPGHRRGHHGHHPLARHGGPQTFRRGRALQFLEFLDVRRSTLLRQLEQPEFADIRPILTGELKAVESIRDEFVAMFNLWPDIGESHAAPGRSDSPPPRSEDSGDHPANEEDGA